MAVVYSFSFSWKRCGFWPVKPSTTEDLDRITHTIAKRVSQYLERSGYLYRDAESEYLDLIPEEEDAMHDIIGASITYRLAFGANAGKKAQTRPANSEQRLSLASRSYPERAMEPG